VGTSRERITQGTLCLLDNSAAYRVMAGAGSPFGDGKAAERIVTHCCAYLETQNKSKRATALGKPSKTKGHGMRAVVSTFWISLRWF